MTERPPLPDDLLADIDRLAPLLTMLDHYAVLGVMESASESEIKAAYLRVIQRFHPDRWHARESGAHRKRMEAIFARATEAYEVLRRADTRLDYDRSLYEIRGIPRPSSQPKAAPPPPPRPPPPPPRPREPHPRAPSVTEMATAVRLMGQLRPPTVPAPAIAPKPAIAPPAQPIPASAPSAHAPSTTHRPTILVVEDDDTLRKMLVRILSELGTVREACDGVEALAIANEDPVPRLIVTDVMMPRMDGLELARHLKASPRTSRVPIVMLTAKSGARDLIDGVNAGARIYVTKPFKVDELKAKAKKAMGVG